MHPPPGHGRGVQRHRHDYVVAAHGAPSRNPASRRPSSVTARTLPRSFAATMSDRAPPWWNPTTTNVPPSLNRPRRHSMLGQRPCPHRCAHCGHASRGTESRHPPRRPQGRRPDRSPPRCAPVQVSPATPSRRAIGSGRTFRCLHDRHITGVMLAGCAGREARCGVPRSTLAHSPRRRSALPWAIRSLSAGLTGSWSKKARAWVIDP